MRTVALGAVLVVIGLAVGRDEGPSFTIKIKTYPDRGHSLLCRDADKQSGSVRFIDSEGNILEEQKPVEESEEVYRLTVLEEGEHYPRRYQHSYSKAVHGNGKRSQTRGYEGETVVYELAEGKYQLKLGEKADVPAGERQGLTARANSDVEAPLDDIFRPGKPVQVGQAWAVDPKLLEKGFGGQGKLDLGRTKGEARLIKAYTKGSRQYGVIEVELEVAYSAMDQLKFNPPALFRIHGTLDTAIDGSTAEGTLKVVSKLTGRTQVEQKGAKLTLEINRTSNVVKERSAGK
jgi:hypothetical protein